MMAAARGVTGQSVAKRETSGHQHTADSRLGPFGDTLAADKGRRNRTTSQLQHYDLHEGFRSDARLPSLTADCC